MIVKMKKITLVTLSAQREEALENLRKTGIAHLNFKEGRSSDLDELLKSRAVTEKALLAVSNAPAEGKGADPSVEAAVSRILHIEEERRALAEELETIAHEHERLEPWGDFEPEDLAVLEEKGISFKLYTLTRDEFEKVSGRTDLFVIERGKTTLRVVTVNCEIEDAVQTPIPARSITALNKRREEIIKANGVLSSELESFGPLQTAIKARLDVIDESIRFERAKILMEQDGGLSYITGFVPVPKIGALRNAAQKHSWALLVQDPTGDDTVPILLENKKPIRIISPMFKLLGALPGYHEHDISLWFLLFFTLFFAMIIGDAGYGLIFLTMTLVAVYMRKSKGKAAGRELALLTVLSSATVVWGALSGTWFGSKAIVEAAPFKYLVIEPISSFNPRSDDNIKFICFVIGTVQILLAHGWSFITQLRQKPRIKALAQLGWAVLVFGAFFLVLNLVLDPIKYPIPNFSLYLILGGFCFVVLFSNQEGNFFKGLLKGFAGMFQTFLNSISAFADVISYIRLFAVGLATVEIAKSFNAMAAEVGSSAAGLIGSILVLGIGHGINLVMGALSVIVHGVRLNMLEFSGHLGMEWSGIPYDPFSQYTMYEPQKEKSKE